MVMAMRFKRLSVCIVFSFMVCCSVVALRIELSAIRLSDGYGLQPSTTISSSRAPRGRTEILLLPKQACSHLHLCPNRLSVDLQGVEPYSLDCKSKRRPVGKPKSYVSDSCGIRTRPSWLERPVTSPEVERAVVGCVGAHL